MSPPDARKVYVPLPQRSKTTNELLPTELALPWSLPRYLEILPMSKPAAIPSIRGFAFTFRDRATTQNCTLKNNRPSDYGGHQTENTISEEQGFSNCLGLPARTVTILSPSSPSIASSLGNGRFAISIDGFTLLI